MLPVRWSISIALVVGLVASLSCAAGEPAGGQSEVLSGGRIPARIIAGRLVISCDLQSSARRIPANLLLEYDAPHGLLLHNRAAAPLRIETADGQTRPFSIRFPDFSIRVEQRGLPDAEELEQFTKYYSAEMGENALVGSIGAEILSRYHVTFDLASGYVELAPPRVRDTQRNEGESEAGSTEIDVTIVNDLVWLPVRYDDGAPGALAIGSSRFDTIIDAAICQKYGHPAGDIGALRCGELDFARVVALRPEEVIQVHPDGVAGVLGLNLLEQHRIEIDRVNRRARITPVATRAFPDEDQAYFRLMIDEDADGIDDWLDAHSGARLAPEASETLLALRLDEDAEAEVVQTALRWVSAAMPKDLRTTRMHDLMLDLGNEGFSGYAVAAGEIGIESGRDDRYPNTVHEIHGKLGEIQLDANEDRDAWRHLLSAAFGLPEDGMINLNLGRYYERADRPRRAFSRYVQAVIKPESAPRALEGMARVQRALDEPFSADIVERMIAGKVRNFGAAGRHEPDAETRTSRTVLVEFFTSANLGDGRGGAIGGALGNQGLLSHFEPSDVVFLSYHLPAPALDPLVNPIAQATAAALGVESPAVHMINGVHQAPGAARWRQGEAVYLACKDVIEPELTTPSDYELELDARLDSGAVSGTLTIRGPEFEGLLAQVVIAERSVIAPGKSEIVIHRMVARGSALGTDLGEPYVRDEEGGMVIPFSRELAEVDAENRAYLDELEASGAGTAVRMSVDIDPNQLVLVALLRRDVSGEVVQALQVVPDGVERGEDES